MGDNAVISLSYGLDIILTRDNVSIARMLDDTPHSTTSAAGGVGEALVASLKFRESRILDTSYKQLQNTLIRIYIRSSAGIEMYICRFWSFRAFAASGATYFLLD